jgi:NAD(P)-dependent dehydrogenase (short-subunit alcohol dehydrogenase family)
VPRSGGHPLAARAVRRRRGLRPAASRARPAGRFAAVEEIANAALFLASDESSYVNATTFLVDGGISQAYTTPQ